MMPKPMPIVRPLINKKVVAAFGMLIRAEIPFLINVAQQRVPSNLIKDFRSFPTAAAAQGHIEEVPTSLGDHAGRGGSQQVLGICRRRPVCWSQQRCCCQNVYVPIPQSIIIVNS